MTYEDSGYNQYFQRDLLESVKVPEVISGSLSQFDFDSEGQGDTVSRTSIGDSSVTTQKLADNSIIDSKIQSVSFDKIISGNYRVTQEGTSFTIGKGGLKFDAGTFLEVPSPLPGKEKGGILFSNLNVPTAKAMMYLTPSGGSYGSGAGNPVLAFDEQLEDFSAGSPVEFRMGYLRSFEAITFNAEKNFSVNVPSGTDGVNFNAHSSNINMDCGTFYINGSPKSAIVPTSKGYRALYTNESPNLWFNDFARVVRPPWWKPWEKPKYVVDPLFLEVVSQPLIFIPTLDKNIVQVWGRRKGHEQRRFELKTKKEFIENNKFWDSPRKRASKSSKT